MQELYKLTARQAVELLKKGGVTPLELIDAAESRIYETDQKVNALPTLCLDRARFHARQIMNADAAELPPWHLHGLPLAVKDVCEVEDVRTTFGSLAFENHVPTKTALEVETLEKNGAVVMAKSNTPEFAAGANTFNEVFGVTVNPWDTSKTCGGSSGGSAVALATGQTWLATGNDLGGSLRTPASFCSVVGLRPSQGRVAQSSLLPWASMSVSGPMGRNVGDAALMLDAQVGRDSRDPISLPRGHKSYVQAVDQPAGPLRVAFSPDLGITPAAAEVTAICQDAALRFEELGVKVERAAPDLSGAEEIFQTLRAASYGGALMGLVDKHRSLLKPDLVWNIEKSLEVTGADIAKAEQGRAELYRRTLEFFDTYDLLLCPTAVTPPFDYNEKYLTELEGVEFETYVSWIAITFAITLTSCPALSLPAGFTESGLPVGLQIVGPPRDEAAVLSAGALLEEMLGLAQLLPIDPRIVD